MEPALCGRNPPLSWGVAGLAGAGLTPVEIPDISTVLGTNWLKLCWPVSPFRSSDTELMATSFTVA